MQCAGENLSYSPYIQGISGLKLLNIKTIRMMRNHFDIFLPGLHIKNSDTAAQNEMYQISIMYACLDTR